MAILRKQLLGVVIFAITMSTGLTWASARQPLSARHAPRRAGMAPQDRAAIRLTTELVSLDVSVTDHGGRAITGLTREDFKVYEDGVEQPTSFFSADEAPASWGIVLDRSGSMEGMIDEVYRAALDAIEQGTDDDDMFVVTFNEQAQLASDFTSDRNKLEGSVRGLRAHGETALYDAVALALDHLQRGRHKKRVLVVITDGGDNHSRLNFRDLVRQAAEANAQIYTVGMFGPIGMRGSAAPDELRKLAKVTGGSAHFPTGIEQCRESMIEIASAVSRQYSIGYYPTDTVRDGKWRKLRVAIGGQNRASGYATRTRQGYYAPTGGVK